MEQKGLAALYPDTKILLKLKLTDPGPCLPKIIPTKTTPMGLQPPHAPETVGHKSTHACQLF